MEKIYLFEAIELLPDKLKSLILEETMSEVYNNDLLSYVKKDAPIPIIIDRSINYQRSIRGARFWENLADKISSSKGSDINLLTEEYVKSFVERPKTSLDFSLRMAGILDRVRAQGIAADPFAGPETPLNPEDLDLDEDGFEEHDDTQF